MKAPQTEKTITMRCGYKNDFILAMEIYNRLMMCIKDLQLANSFLNSGSRPAPYEKNFAEMDAKFRHHKEQKALILKLFDLINAWKNTNFPPKGLDQILLTLKIVPCLFNPAEDNVYYRILADMVISEMTFKNCSLTNPFRDCDTLYIEGIELAEVILSMYKLAHPFPDSPQMSGVTLQEARDCVSKHASNSSGRYFDRINLGAGSVCLKIIVAPGDKKINVAEFNNGRPYAQIALAKVMKKTKMFSHFTGYSKGQTKVMDIKPDSVNEACYFIIEKTTALSTLKKNDNVQIDGVLALITECDDTTLTVCTTNDLLANTSLPNVKVGANVNVGLSAMHDSMENTHYLLEASATNKVKLVSSQPQEGHEQTLQLDFEATEILTEIHDGHHIGLAGLSLTAQNVKHENNHTRFSIFAARQTRELSGFNDTMAIGTEVNLTVPTIN